MHCSQACRPGGGAEGVSWEAGEVVAGQGKVVRPPVVGPGGVAGVGDLLAVCGGLEGVPAQLQRVVGGGRGGQQAVGP